MAGVNVVEFTDTNFKSEVLDAKEPVLVDFWAPWCGPCRRIAPMIDELASENVGAAKVGKVNIDENSGSAEEYGGSRSLERRSVAPRQGRSCVASLRDGCATLDTAPPTARDGQDQGRAGKTGQGRGSG